MKVLSSEENCLSSQSDSQYGSPPRGWSEEMDEHGHTLYVSDYTNEKVQRQTQCVSACLTVFFLTNSPQLKISSLIIALLIWDNTFFKDRQINSFHAFHVFKNKSFASENI